ncbi:MAG: hypothetical protein AB1758_26930, partial [Candidatus Eremiobacterota bacterium]
GATFFLLHPLVMGWCYRNRVDVLGLALCGIALCWADRRTPASPRRWIGVGLLLSAALFTKQTFIAAPLAVLANLLWRGQRRDAVALVGVMAGAMGLGLLILYLLNGPSFVEALVRYNALPVRWAQMIYFVNTYRPSMGPLALLALAGLLRGGWKQERLWLLFTLASLGPVVGTARSGAFYNYFLEFHLGLSALGALGACRLVASGRWPSGLAQALVLAQLGMASTVPLSFMDRPWDYLRHEFPVLLRGRYPAYLAAGYDSERLRVWLDRHPGPILAENVGNPVVMGRLPWLCDPATYDNLIRLGLFDPGEITGRIQRREFELVLLQRTRGNIRFSPEIIETILQNYRPVDQVGVDTVFLRRE